MITLELYPCSVESTLKDPEHALLVGWGVYIMWVQEGYVFCYDKLYYRYFLKSSVCLNLF